MAATPNSFYWYDLETTGLKHSWDRITQFAGRRTDLDLNPIDEPYVTYIKLPPQVLPDPKAALITKLTPQYIQQHGIAEYDAIREIHRRLAQPGTCSLGYNSIAFDDEFIRYTLYRNLLPPYEHTWKNGNSRDDLIRIARSVAALYPSQLEWEIDDKGRPKLSLASIAAANGIDAADAHDALADVNMSIGVARKIKQAVPGLWHYLESIRHKRAVAKLFESSSRMLLHVDRQYHARRRYVAPIKVLARDPGYQDRFWVADLGGDLSELESSSPEELLAAMSRKRPKEGELGKPRLGIWQVRANQCPALFEIVALNDEEAERFQVDRETVERNITFVERLYSRKFKKRMEELILLRANELEKRTDPEDVFEQLYQGFYSSPDAQRCERIHAAIRARRSWPQEQFDDLRLPKLANRLRVAVSPEDVPELIPKLNDYVRTSLLREDVGLPKKRDSIGKLRKENVSPEDERTLRAVEAYYDTIAKQFELT